MKARMDGDYKGGDQGKLGQMGGKYRHTMNEAFDTRGKEAENNQKMLFDAIESNKKKYEQ